jgi:hypothetical protein
VMRERRLAAGRERSRAQHLPSGCAAKIWPSFGSKTVIELAPHICERNSFSDRIIKAVEATSADQQSYGRASAPSPKHVR